MESKVLVIQHVSRYTDDDGLQKKIDAALKVIEQKDKGKWFVHSANTDVSVYEILGITRWDPPEKRFFRTAILVLHQEQENGNHKN